MTDKKKVNIFYRSHHTDEEAEHFNMEPYGFLLSVDADKLAEKLVELENDPDVYDVKVVD